MAGTITELRRSRRQTHDDAMRQYLISNESDESVARTLLGSTAPGTIGSLVLGNNYGVEEAGKDLWLGTANYKRANSPSQGSASVQELNWTKINYSTNGATQHITQAIDETVYMAAGEAAKTYNGVIGRVQDGNRMRAEGVDIPLRALGFTITKVLAASTLTETFNGNLYALSTTVNNTTFTHTDSRGVKISFAAGEGQFLYAETADHQDLDKVVVTFHFTAAPNKTNITEIPNITISSKKGQQYLWVDYALREDAGEKGLKLVPIAAIVNTVKEVADWSPLGLADAV